MTTYHKDFHGLTASITDKKDGTARLLSKDIHGRKVIDKIYKSRKGALIAWGKICS